MLYIVYAYFLFKIKNFYKKKEPTPFGMGPPESSLSNFGCERFFENINHLNDNEHLIY